MKFLIIAKVRHPPVDVWAKLLPAHFKYLDELERKKTIEVSYHLIGHQGDALAIHSNHALSYASFTSFGVDLQVVDSLLLRLLGFGFWGNVLS